MLQKAVIMHLFSIAFSNASSIVVNVFMVCFVLCDLEQVVKKTFFWK